MKLADVHQNKPILARKLKRIRTHIANMTQSEFAESLGITRIYVSQLENPDSPKYPSSDLIRRISDIYHIDYEYLINTQSLSPTLDRRMEIVLKNSQKTSYLYLKQRTVLLLYKFLPQIIIAS